MKKIFSLLAAASLALGLIGCSGDLHDSEAYDMSNVSLVGKFQGWNTDSGTALTDNGDGTYSCEFVASAETEELCFYYGSWATSFRGTSDDKLAELTIGGEADLYPHDDLNCMPMAGCKVGTTYKFTITPAVGYIHVKVVEGVTPPTVYFISGSTPTEMEITGDGIYTYKVTADSTTLSFQLLDSEGVIYGVTSDSVALSTETKLSTAKTAKAINVTTVADKDYVVTVDYTNKKVTVEKDAYKAYIIGDITKGDFVRMENVSDTVLTYTFTYSAKDMTAWTGNEDGVYFIINDKDGWSGNTKLFFDVDLTVGSDFVASGSNGDNNAKVKLTDGNEYTVIFDATNESGLKAKIIPNIPLYIAGGMNSWSFEELSYDATSAYYSVTEALADSEFKVKKVGSWDSDDDNIFVGATVSTTEVVSLDDNNNAKVSAAVGQKIRFYKNSSNKWAAKVE